MNTTRDFDRLARAWLDEGPTELADVALDAALDQVHLTRQRRATRVPWRFHQMPALTRATGIAAVALVTVVGAGAIYLNAPGGSGGKATPSAAPTADTPGISAWKTYTSPVYGYTIDYPEDWSVVDRATHKWRPGEPEDSPSKDVFYNNAPDPDDMVFQAFQMPAEAGADLGSWDGLLDALEETCGTPTDSEFGTCPSATAVTQMCLGSTGCQPVAFLHDDDLPRAVLGDPETGSLTYLLVGREDDFPAAERYGGTVKLLKSILSRMGVREPAPGETVQ